MVGLFSDAELPENLSEDFVGGDFAEDGVEGVDGGAEVLGKEVGRDAGVQTGPDAGKVLTGGHKGLVVAETRH